MAYDSQRQQVVLFGGYDEDINELQDTWVWDGADWTQRRPAASPPPLGALSMAGDNVRNEVVLFGGIDVQCAPSCAQVYNKSTWLWDGNNWSEATPPTSPLPRFASAMEFDSRNGRVLLFGGGNDNSGQILDDLWAWDGTTWTQLEEPTKPVPIPYGHSMAFDEARGTTVLFGGREPFTFDGWAEDTWTHDGVAWSAAMESNRSWPKNTWGQTATYDQARNEIVMFGGARHQFAEGTKSETWT